MILNTVNSKFEKFSQTNNVSPEIIEHQISNGEKSYTLVIKDILKYPDEFSNLLYSFPHFKNESDWCARPGSSFLFPQEWIPKCTFFIRQQLFDLLKVNLDSLSLYTNCFSGKMNTHFVPPHIDYDYYSRNTHLAANLGLTKYPKEINNGTSFWTFKGKRGILEMNTQEMNDYNNSMSESWTNISEWNNSDETSEWNLEYVVQMEYNSLVVYSPTLFHIPLFDHDYFCGKDRFSLASMYNVRVAESHELPDELKVEAFDIWNKLELCKIFNYYF